jgi:hypothetical protein
VLNRRLSLEDYYIPNDKSKIIMYSHFTYRLKVLFTEAIIYWGQHLKDKYIDINERDALSGFKNKFKHAVMTEHYEDGFLSPSNHLVEQALGVDQLLTSRMLLEMFFSGWDGNKALAIGVARQLSCFDYEDFHTDGGNIGDIIARFCLHSEDCELIECCIRAYERWEKPEQISLLRKLTLQEKWLQIWVEELIRYHCDHKCNVELPSQLILSGFAEGDLLRDSILQQLPNQTYPSEIIVHVPKVVEAILPSYFEGVFTDLIQQMGGNAFKDKIKIVCSKENKVRFEKSLREGISRVERKLKVWGCSAKTH